jgi:hypothetical protein
MSARTRKKIIRLLAVGFDTDDGHVRITTGDKFDVLMGSDESHEYMLQLISKIEEEISRRGLDLDGLSPETLGEIVRDLR